MELRGGGWSAEQDYSVTFPATPSRRSILSAEFPGCLPSGKPRLFPSSSKAESKWASMPRPGRRRGGCQLSFLYYGCGSLENYCDMHHAAPVDLHESTAAQEYMRLPHFLGETASCFWNWNEHQKSTSKFVQLHQTSPYFTKCYCNVFASALLFQ